MSCKNLVFMAGYLLLVGLPIAGLLQALRIGGRLTAPTSVEGVWTIEPASIPTSRQHCASFVTNLDRQSLEIVQSGKEVTIVLAAIAGSGTGEIHGISIQGAIRTLGPPGAAHGCGVLTLFATVDSAAQPRNMVGTLSVAGCAACALMNFRAVRHSSSYNRGAP